jgi:hypothetical protein
MQLPNIGGIRIPKEWTKHAKIIADIPPEEWDGFHAFILQDELMRCGSAGYIPAFPCMRNRKKEKEKNTYASSACLALLAVCSVEWHT